LRNVVAHVIDSGQQHHRVIFVNHVVTVQWEPPDEVTETEKHFCFHVVLQPENILPASRNQSGARGRIAVDRKGLKLLEVHVDWMLPSTRVVLEDPLLDGIAFD
jgi:hypothetical protein